jgi:hypothetical protein
MRLTSAILEIKDSILLEDRAKHSLDNNTWAWVGDERRLFMQLLGEEINTQVSMLASGRRGCDADDLARTTLKDQEIPDADVVAGNGNGVGSCRVFRGTADGRLAITCDGNVNFFPLAVMVMVVMRWETKDSIRSTVKTMAE